MSAMKGNGSERFDGIGHEFPSNDELGDSKNNIVGENNENENHILSIVDKNKDCYISGMSADISSGNISCESKDLEPVLKITKFADGALCTGKDSSGEDIWHNAEDKMKNSTQQAVNLRRNASIKRKSLIQSIISPGSGSPNLPSPLSHCNNNGSAGGFTNSAALNPNAVSWGYQQKCSSQGSGHSRASSSGSIRSEDEALTDVSAMLQTLATRELEVLEQRKNVEDLRKHLELEERTLAMQMQELDGLKLKVSYALDPNSGGSLNHIRGVPPASEQVVIQNQEARNATQSLQGKSRPSKNIERSSSRRSSAAGSAPPKQGTTVPPVKQESVWSKSLSLLNDFDQLLQQGLEKKLGFEDIAPSQHLSSTKTYSKSNRVLLEDKGISFWGFVQDFKATLLSLGEIGYPPDTPTGQKQRNENHDPKLTRSNSTNKKRKNSAGNKTRLTREGREGSRKLVTIDEKLSQAAPVSSTPRILHQQERSNTETR
ncbi:HBL276Cp [Eremothecium sinecaudum]|uniref:Topoisomerase I damage affected protein 11 n=1 Tax=Eremothecium sinecaudum TaxID=45286 RepID=A0A109UW18_9SACH|nr:HBL276Cp [Eremothecium sinecaudum]AMD18626.1 HBL276Cp [Eremothecium sinecaudum]